MLSFISYLNGFATGRVIKLLYTSDVPKCESRRMKSLHCTVCSIVGPKQNAGSLLTAVSDTVLFDLSHGTLSFALHGSFFNHFLICGDSSTANQIL